MVRILTRWSECILSRADTGSKLKCVFSEMSASLSIEAGRWSRLVLAVTPSKGTIEVSYDNTSLLTYTQNQYTNVLVTAVSIYVLSGKGKSPKES